MRMFTAAAAIAAVLLASSARADITVDNSLLTKAGETDKTSGVWITIYDPSKTIQYDRGCIGTGYRFSNAVYNNSLGIKGFIVRAEVTPDAACKQPKICDTTAQAKGDAWVYVSGTASKCYLDVTVSPEQQRAAANACDADCQAKQAQTRANAYKFLPGCRSQEKTAYDAAKSFYDKLMATGKAPNDVKAESDQLNLIKTDLAPPPANDGNVLELMKGCESMTRYLDSVNAILNKSVSLLTPAGKAVNTLLPRIHVTDSSIQASQRRLGACAGKAGVFRLGEFTPVTKSGDAIEGQLTAYAAQLKNNTSTDPKDFAAAGKVLDGYDAQADKFSAAVDKQCATVH